MSNFMVTMSNFLKIYQLTTEILYPQSFLTWPHMTLTPWPFKIPNKFIYFLCGVTMSSLMKIYQPTTEISHLLAWVFHIWPWPLTPWPWIPNQFIYPSWWVTTSCLLKIHQLTRDITPKFFSYDLIWPWPLTWRSWKPNQFINPSYKGQIIIPHITCITTTKLIYHLHQCDHGDPYVLVSVYINVHV